MRQRIGGIRELVDEESAERVVESVRRPDELAARARRRGLDARREVGNEDREGVRRDERRGDEKETRPTP